MSDKCHFKFREFAEAIENLNRAEREQQFEVVVLTPKILIEGFEPGLVADKNPWGKDARRDWSGYWKDGDLEAILSHPDKDHGFESIAPEIYIDSVLLDRGATVEPTKVAAEKYDSKLENPLPGSRKMPSTRIVLPPATLELRFGRMLLSRKAFNEVLKPSIEDMRLECWEALQDGDRVRARIVVARWRWTILKVIFLSLPIGWIRKLVLGN